jgi:hypothetical protein
MTISRNLVRGAVAAAALATAALLPAAAASAAPAPTAAPATVAVDVCTVIHDGTAFYDLSGRILGFVQAGQKMNLYSYYKGYWIGTLWGRTDRSQVSARHMSCPV